MQYKSCTINNRNHGHCVYIKLSSYTTMGVMFAFKMYIMWFPEVTTQVSQ